MNGKLPTFLLGNDSIRIGCEVSVMQIRCSNLLFGVYPTLIPRRIEMKKKN